MKKTYEIGAKRKYTYAVNVPERRLDTSDNRRNLIVSIIEQNPDILHTHIIKLSEIIDNIPKIIVEKKLEELKKEMIIMDKKNTSSNNGLRTWRIFSDEDDWEKEAMIAIDLLLKHKKELKEFGISKNKQNEFQKNLQVTYLIKLISELLTILYIFPQNDKSKQITKKTKDLQTILDGLYANISTGDSHNAMQIINILKKDCQVNLKYFTNLKSN